MVVKLRFNLAALFPVKIPLSEQVLLAKHLSMILKSGISQVESLAIIKDQSKDKRLKKLLTQVSTSIQNGQSLSDALSKFKQTFGVLFINLVKLGEASGTLPENLEYLSEELKKRAGIKSKVKSAMIYPIIILVATIAITLGLVIFVLPKFLKILTSLNVALPGTTKILIAVTNFVNTQYVLLFGIVFFLIVALKLLKKVEFIKFFFNQIALIVPISGKIVINYNMANIARTLSLLLKSGVRIVEAISSTAEGISNAVIRNALSNAVTKIKEGDTLYQSLDLYPRLFPVILRRMIQIGEKTGNLDSNLAYLAGFYEEEVDEQLKNLSSILEPALMVFMGALVGFVAISIITPIYALTQGV